MKRDAVGRVSYTQGQREALLDKFERSGLKGVQFARAAGVKYQTLPTGRSSVGMTGGTRDAGPKCVPRRCVWWRRWWPRLFSG